MNLTLNQMISARRGFRSISGFLFIATIVLSLSACNKEKPCSTPLNQIPDIRGFRLEQTIEQLRQKYPNWQLAPPNRFGFTRVMLDARTDADKMTEYRPYRILEHPEDSTMTVISARQYPDLAEIDHAYLDFVDGKLVRMDFYYKDSLSWESSARFAEQIKRSLHLNGDWHVSSNDSCYMLCFESNSKRATHVEAGIVEDHAAARGRHPHLKVEDFFTVNRFHVEARERIKAEEEQTKKAEQEKKEQFRP